MKQKKIAKKLELGKESITTLANDQLVEIKGGFLETRPSGTCTNNDVPCML